MTSSAWTGSPLSSRAESLARAPAPAGHARGVRGGVRLGVAGSSCSRTTGSARAPGPLAAKDSLRQAWPAL